MLGVKVFGEGDRTLLLNSEVVNKKSEKMPVRESGVRWQVSYSEESLPTFCCLPMLELEQTGKSRRQSSTAFFLANGPHHSDYTKSVAV
jgi:hypothetical protein